MREIFLECIISRTKKSLEHLKRIIEFYYKDVIQPLFLAETRSSSQMTLANTLAAIWVNNPKKHLQIVEKLFTMGVLDAQFAIKAAFARIKTQLAQNQTLEAVNEEIISALLRLSAHKTHQLFTIYSQKDNPISQRERDRLQFESEDPSGQPSQQQHLDLSFSKRVTIKSNQDFLSNFDQAVNERNNILKSVADNYLSLLQEFDSSDLESQTMRVLRSRIHVFGGEQVVNAARSQ